jgi:hypothetical protein
MSLVGTTTRKAAGVRIHHLYADEQGESHWGNIHIDLTSTSLRGTASDKLPARGMIFYEMPALGDPDWHVAPRRQYVVHLNGAADITASDGETRTIQAGEIVLLEDVFGKGHHSSNAVRRPYHCLFVPID